MRHGIFHRWFGRCCHNFMRKRMMRRITKRLQLNGAQQQQLAELVDRLQSTHRQLHSQKQQAHMEFLALLDQAEFDRDHATQLLQQNLDNLANESRTIIDGFADLFDQLDDEQQQRLRNQLQSHCHTCCC